MMFWRLLMVTGWLISAGGLAEANLDYIEDLNGKQTEKQSELVQWTHSRLVFNKDIKRVAVGQNSIIEVDVLGGRELLMLAKNVGRTTLMVWYEDGTSQTLLFGVSQDMSVLKDALYDIHDQIRLEVAPDRPALVLRGKVPNIQFKLAADAAARNYLNAERPKSSGQAMNSPQSPLDFLASAQQTVTDAFRLNGNSGFSQTSVAVINLIQVETLPQSLEKK